MKKTLAARLVLGALATIAAGSVMAGQIQASSVSIAREVITTDTQTVIAPSISYRFFGDVDAKVQKQTFQVQFTLGAGEWAVAPTAGAISITDGVTGVIQDQSTAAPVAPAVAAYQVTNIDLSADKKTVWATIEVAQAATALIKQPIIALNVTSNTITGVAGTNVAAQRGTVHGLYSVVGDLLNDYNTAKKCVDVKTLPVSFKHYVALTNPGAMASDATATADEHTRQTSTNAATLITFPTNLKVAFTKGANAISLAPGGNQTFTGPAWVAKNAFVDANNALLGDVYLVQNALGYDGNLMNEYILAEATVPAGVKERTLAANQIGEVEAKNLRVTVSATEGYVVGGTLALNTNSNCAVATRIGTTGTVAITAANAAGPITLLHPTTGLNATFGAAGTTPVYVCYTVPGSTMIPSSSFSVEAQLIKADPGAPNDEQDNICNSDYISLGGGLKIDVRNYASSKEKASSGYESVIRLINNSDSRKADVWAQIIHQDGKLGGWGKIADLPVRGVKNMSASEIEALLTNAPTATQPVALGEANGAIAPTADGKQAPRLRITSNSGTTLRVQNYHYNHVTNQLLEVSGAQGVDFENLATNRVPPTAVDAQPVAQDALSGLNLKN